MRCLTVLEIAHCNAIASSRARCLEGFEFDSGSFIAADIAHWLAQVAPGAVRALGLQGDYFGGAAA